MDDFSRLDACAMAQLVRSGEVQPIELVEAAIASIERLNPALNAVVTPMFESARAEAVGELPDGPLRGVPFLLKDAVAEKRGSRLTFGSSLLGDYVSERDSVLVSRLRRAGLVVVGKASTPEFGIMGTTEPARFGPARNPWDLERSVGGSSGGSAAAVAAGLVPIAHGTDSGGSIRIPAAWCGTFGLKPTRGRNSLAPGLGDAASGLLCEHGLSRSVRDSATLLDATAGPVAGDPYFAPPPARPFVDEVSAAPGRLRLSWSVAAPFGLAVDDDCARAVRKLAELCEELGHDVTEARLPEGIELLEGPLAVVSSVGLAWEIRRWARVVGREPSEASLEPLSWFLYESGLGWAGREYLEAVEALQRISRSVAGFFESFDAHLSPVCSTPSLPIGSWALDGADVEATIAVERKTSPFTALYNVTGQPAMSVPFGWTNGGLPVGVQIAGRFGDEATLLRLAAQLEEATGWRMPRPPVVG
jgi:amidase